MVRKSTNALLISVALLLGSCGSATEPAENAALETKCFTTNEKLVLPADYIASDVSGDGEACLFVLQAEGLADTTVIAGELFSSSNGRTFEEFVAEAEADLAVGKEPDLLSLQLLNSGASGRELTISERQELDSPNRAVILTHDSDRRDGFVAHTAVVDVPSTGTSTFMIKLWGLSNPTNDQLIVDLVNSMEIVTQET